MSSFDVQQALEGHDLVRGDHIAGIYKAIVEDIQDPFSLGRIRARVYGLYGGKEATPTNKIPWSESVSPLQGSFDVPAVGDRVWVMFENSHRHNPVWFGYWTAIPTGTGEEIFSKRQGSEVPREVWAADRLQPRACSIARSWEGNQIWFTDETEGDYYHGTLNIQDAGGKLLRLESWIPGTAYLPTNPEETRHRKKDLYNAPGRTQAGSVTLSGAGLTIAARHGHGDAMVGKIEMGESAIRMTNEVVNVGVGQGAGIRATETGLLMEADDIALLGMASILPRPW